MSITNFFSNLFNGTAFTVNASDLRDRATIAESAAAAANSRANKLEEENAVLKSDKIAILSELEMFKTGVSVKDAQINEYAHAAEMMRMRADEVVKPLEAEISRLNSRIIELEKNQRPPRENGRFISTKPETAKKKAKPPKIAKPAV